MKIPLNGAHLHFLQSPLSVCVTERRGASVLPVEAITELHDKGISSGRAREMKIESGPGGAPGKARLLEKLEVAASAKS